MICYMFFTNSESSFRTNDLYQFQFGRKLAYFLNDTSLHAAFITLLAISADNKLVILLFFFFF